MKIEFSYRRKRFLYGVAGLSVCLMILATWYFYDRFSYAKPLPPYSVGKDKNHDLIIGIIGDSWILKKN